MIDKKLLQFPFNVFINTLMRDNSGVHSIAVLSYESHSNVLVRPFVENDTLADIETMIKSCIDMYNSEMYLRVDTGFVEGVGTENLSDFDYASGNLRDGLDLRQMIASIIYTDSNGENFIALTIKTQV